MFLDERLIIAFVLDDAGKSLIFDGFLCRLCLYINDRVAQRTGIACGAFVGGEMTRTGRIGKFDLIENAVCGVDFLLADRTQRLVALGLVKK